MSQFITYGGVDIGGHLRLAEGITGMTSHADGSFGAGEATIDDPDADFSLVSLQEFIHEESACDPVRTFTGFLAQRRLTRGNQYVGAGRDHNLDILDLNYLLHLQPLRGAEAKRPVETGDARLAWLLGSVALDGIVYDNGLIGSNANSFDEADYTHQYADDVLRDLCVSSIVETGRIFFVYYDHDTGQPSLFMDVPTVTSYTSTLSISNDLADVDATTLAPYRDAELSSSGEDIYCSVFFKYKTGTVFRHNDVTHATYFASKGYHRQGVFETTRVGSQATAIRHADAWLANHSGDLDTITCQLLVPASQVNLIEAGMRVNCKFTHFPGYDTFGYLRVASRTVGLSPLANDLYEMRLVLSNRTITPAGTGGGSTGDFPLPPPSAPSIVQQVSGLGNLELPDTPSPGNTGVYIAAFRSGGGPSGWLSGGAPAFPGWTHVRTETTFSHTYQVGMYYKTFGGETAPKRLAGGTGLNPNTGAAGTFYELPGPWTPDVSDAANGSGTLEMAAGPISAPRNAIAFTVGGFGLDDGAYDSAASGFSFTPGAGWTEDLDSHTGSGGPSVWTAHAILAAAASVTGDATHSGVAAPYREWAMQVAAFTSENFGADDQPPDPAQWVYGETPTPAPDGSTTTFTTQFPFADGSLRVWVDNLDQTAAVTSYDGATGSFTLAFAVRPSEQLLVDYQGR